MVDFTWTSYSRVYMIIKNEVKFILAEDNLNLIIITASSLQLQLTLDALTFLQPPPSNKYRVEWQMASAKNQTPSLVIGSFCRKSNSY